MVREAKRLDPRFVSRRRRNVVAQERDVNPHTRPNRRCVLEAHRPPQAVVTLPSVLKKGQIIQPRHARHGGLQDMTRNRAAVGIAKVVAVTCSHALDSRVPTCNPESPFVGDRQ